MHAGFLTMLGLEQCRLQFQKVMALARAKTGSIKLLVVSPEAQVQSGKVMEEHKSESFMTDPRDRMAVVVSSHLARIQAKRNFKPGQEEAFLSESEAVAWLMSQGLGDGERQAGAIAA